MSYNNKDYDHITGEQTDSLAGLSLITDTDGFMPGEQTESVMYQDGKKAVKVGDPVVEIRTRESGEVADITGNVKYGIHIVIAFKDKTGKLTHMEAYTPQMLRRFIMLNKP